MTKFLDLRTSQNASYANSISIPILVVNSPQLVGRIGLATQTAGTNIRVILSGTTSLQLPLLPAVTSVTLTVVRGTLPTDPLIYSATENMDLNILGPQVFSLTALDFNPPASTQLTYTMFVSSSLIGVVRVGPESFSGIAVSD